MRVTIRPYLSVHNGAGRALAGYCPRSGGDPAFSPAARMPGTEQGFGRQSQRVGQTIDGEILVNYKCDNIYP